MRFFNFDIGLRIRTNREIELEKELEQRNAQTGPTGWGNTWDSLMSGGGVITRKMALSVPAVYAAVDVVSKTLASIPFSIFRRTENGSEEYFGHPLHRVITREPYPYYTAFNFRRDIIADACFGNAFAKIHTKGNMRARYFEHIPPENVTLYYAEDGSLYYLVNYGWGAARKTEVLFQHEILHVRGMSIEQWQGIDIAKTFSSSLSMSIDATEYGGNFFHNNANIGGVVEHPGALTPVQRQMIEDKINAKHTGKGNAGGTMVLDAGMKYQKSGTNPQEAMLNETRMFQAYESCRIFGVPAHMINVLDRSTFNNIEMMDNGFVKYCLVPWAEQFEQEVDAKTLTIAEKDANDVFTRHDLSGLMRGDMKSQAEYDDKMLKNMVFTINDVRRRNNLNTVPWGDLPYAQAGVTPVNEDGTIDLNTPAETQATGGNNNQDNGQPGTEN
jgi:HK97 family phage portal protein